MYIYIHREEAPEHPSSEGVLRKVSFNLSATAVCVLCVKIQSECSNNVEVI